MFCRTPFFRRSLSLICLVFRGRMARVWPIPVTFGHSTEPGAGEVRFARDVKGDPLAGQNATWDAAELNLPIRQGYCAFHR